MVKIIIVGSGIAGLAAYLYLKKNLTPAVPDLEITIYESHRPRATVAVESATFEELSSSTNIVGGGLGVSPNGMRMLREISEELHDSVANAGFVCENFVFRGARGYKLNVSPTSDFRGVKKGLPAGQQEFCVSISRQGLREALLAQVGADNIVYKKVLTADRGTGNQKPKVNFEDGTSDEADLIIGADGVKSVVLKGIFEGEDDRNTDPVYEGLIGVGGFLPGPLPQSVVDDKCIVFTFGPNGFFGYGSAGKDNAMWWSTWEADQPPAQRKINVDEMKAQLQNRHGKWKDPVIHNIISKCDVDSILPVWTTPELPKWGDGGLLVLGDAAHALPPTSGQGSSQALEDAKCLSLLLSKLFATSSLPTAEEKFTAQIPDATKAFYEIRNPRIQKILARTKMMAGRKGDIGVVGEFMTYFFFWLVGKVPAVGKALIGDVNQELYYWPMEQLIDEAVGKYGEKKKA